MNINKITISGKICTRKNYLTEESSKKLHWPIFMTGKLFREYVKKNQLNLDQVEEQNDEVTKKLIIKFGIEFIHQEI